MTNNKPNDVRVVSVELLELIEGCLRVPDGCPLEIWKEVERTVNGYRAELRAILAQPADQQGEPVMRLEAEKLWGGDGEYSVDFVKSGWLKECREKGGTFLLYARAQPATAKVVLPERKPSPCQSMTLNEVETWNACLDEVAKLNSPQ